MYAFDAAVNNARVISVPRLPGFKIDVEGDLPMSYGSPANSGSDNCCEQTSLASCLALLFCSLKAELKGDCLLKLMYVYLELKSILVPLKRQVRCCRESFEDSEVDRC